MIIAISILLALETCAPGLVDITDRLDRRGQIQHFSRDAIRKITLDTCWQPTDRRKRYWSEMMTRRPLTDEKLRREFIRVTEGAKVYVEIRPTQVKP